MKNAFNILLLVVIVVFSCSCSFNKMIVKLSMPVVKARMQAMLHEDDYEMARASLPGYIKSLESMLVSDPDNPELHVYAAYAYYSYAFAFVEDEDRERASTLYYRCLEHGKNALNAHGIKNRHINGPTDKFERLLQNTSDESIHALFWTGMCWGKIIEMNQQQLLNVLQWHKAVMMMRQVYSRDKGIYMQGPNLFFGVYYGGRPPLLGGDEKLSEQYFNRARKASDSELLIVDVLQALYLERQRGNRQGFHDRLTSVLNAPAGYSRDYALINAIARQKAKHLLEKEQDWF